MFHVRMNSCVCYLKLGEDVSHCYVRRQPHSLVEKCPDERLLRRSLQRSQMKSLMQAQFLQYLLILLSHHCRSKNLHRAAIGCSLGLRTLLVLRSEAAEARMRVLCRIFAYEQTSHSATRFNLYELRKALPCRVSVKDTCSEV